MSRFSLSSRLLKTVFGVSGATKMIMEIVEDALEKHIDTLCLWIGPFPYILVMGAGDIQVSYISKAQCSNVKGTS